MAGCSEECCWGKEGARGLDDPSGSIETTAGSVLDAQVMQGRAKAGNKDRGNEFSAIMSYTFLFHLAFPPMCGMSLQAEYRWIAIRCHWQSCRPLHATKFGQIFQ